MQILSNQHAKHLFATQRQLNIKIQKGNIMNKQREMQIPLNLHIMLGKHTNASFHFITKHLQV